jgi:putative intracellular protease/amidase
VDAACHDGRWPAGWPKRAAPRPVTSVCNGVFLLAAAGLVEGRRVTGHWGRAWTSAHQQAPVRRGGQPPRQRSQAIGARGSGV